jgi:hypothetical protein
MSVKLTGDLDVFRRVKFTDAQRMRTAASRLAVQIVMRTRSGRDENGRYFAAYSPAYAKRKGSTKVDLLSIEHRAHMLDGLDVLTATKTRATIGWTDSTLAERASANEDGGQGRPPRPFLSASEAMLDELVASVEAGFQL